MPFNPSFLLLLVIPAILALRKWNVLHQNYFGPRLVKETLVNYCESWKLNVELNNIRAFDVVPNECVAYVGNYMTMSQYMSDVQKAVEQCTIYLTSEVVPVGDDKDAWVLDVDSTLLSVVPYYMNHSFGGEEIHSTDLDSWKEQRIALAIGPILLLYSQINDRGLKIFLISSRDEKLRNATTDNLNKAGYSSWTSLILRSSNDSGFKDIQSYKKQKRLELTQQGYRIWGVVGDQWSSLLGSPRPKRFFKLPNPMYYES